MTMTMYFSVYGMTESEIREKAEAEAKRFWEGTPYNWRIEVKPSVIGRSMRNDRNVMEYEAEITSWPASPILVVE